MSKVSIELDTKTDELVVKVDGKELSNVCDISIYTYSDYKGKPETSISIGLVDRESEEDDLRAYTRLSAAYKEDVGNAKVETKQVYQDIANFLKVKK